mmetsp:Transcript_19512/g.47647  ORF Transcript_19512/g.47647 Transcript_19512/m.47647 type:complete len:462 (-) Transcript_19512:345-1730(-)
MHNEGKRRGRASQPPPRMPSRTATEASVEVMLATSASPTVDMQPSAMRNSSGSGPAQPGGAAAARTSRDKRHTGDSKQFATMDSIQFTKEVVMSPRAEDTCNLNSNVSALANILKEREKDGNNVFQTGGDPLDDGLEPLDDDEDEGNIEARYRTRTCSVHSADPSRAVQAAKAYDITLASKEHRHNNPASPGSVDSGSMYIGSTPSTTTYNPNKPGTFQLSDKFRCTVHLSSEVMTVCRASASTKEQKGRAQLADRNYKRGHRVSSTEKKQNKWKLLKSPRSKAQSPRPNLDSDASIGIAEVAASQGTTPRMRDRTTSHNNPHSMVGMSGLSYVQLQIGRERTADEILWKAIRAYLKIMGTYSENVVITMQQSHAFQLWLGEEDGNVDEVAPALAPGHRVAETGSNSFVVQCTPIIQSGTKTSTKKTTRTNRGQGSGFFDWFQNCVCCCSENTESPVKDVE